MANVNEVRTATIPVPKQKVGCNTQNQCFFIVCYGIKVEADMQICTFLDWSK